MLSICRAFGLLCPDAEVPIHPLCLASFEATQLGNPPLTKEWSLEINHVLTQIRSELQDQLFLYQEGEGLRLTKAGKLLACFLREQHPYRGKDPAWLDDLSFRSFCQAQKKIESFSSKMIALAWYASAGRPLRSPEDLKSAISQVREFLGRGEVRTIPDLPEKSSDNLTVRWFHTHWVGVYPELVRKIRSKCQTSDRIGQVEDHAMNFVRKAIQRDAFRSRIEENRPIPYSQVAVYAVRSALNDIRDTGSDAVCREILGSRTEREVREGTGPDRNPIRTRQSFRSKAVRFRDGACVDLIDAKVSKKVDLDETILFDQVWGRIETLIRKRFRPEEFDMVLGFLKERIQGSSVQEAAQNLKIEPLQAQRYSKLIKTRLGVPVRNLIAN